MTTPSAQIRAGLDHPLIDGDSHIIEYTPVLMDYIKQFGGSDAVTDYRSNMRGGRTGPGWYQMNWEERRDSRSIRAPGGRCQRKTHWIVVRRCYPGFITKEWMTLVWILRCYIRL